MEFLHFIAAECQDGIAEPQLALLFLRLKKKEKKYYCIKVDDVILQDQAHSSAVWFLISASLCDPCMFFPVLVWVFSYSLKNDCP